MDSNKENHSTKRLTQSEFLERCVNVHGDVYDYSEAVYVNQTTKVKIICRKHGEFYQTPKGHFRGDGCPKCAAETISKKLTRGRTVRIYSSTAMDEPTTDCFIKKAREVHGDRYDYGKTVYIGRRSNVTITCPIHGDFLQTPENHLMGKGCMRCGGRAQKVLSDVENELESRFKNLKAIKYISLKEPCTISCCRCSSNGEIHGEFDLPSAKTIFDKRNRLLCPKCIEEERRNRYASNTEDFIKKSKAIFGSSRYDYSLSKYGKNNTEKITVICHEKDVNGVEHGPFEVTAANHLKGRGCPKCKSDGFAYETRLYAILCDIFPKDEIIREYRNRDILGRLSVDFIIPKYKIAIEHQGSQHFGSCYLFKNESEENRNKKYDRIRLNDVEKYDILTNKMGYKVLYFSFEGYAIPPDYIDKVYTDLNEFKDLLYNIIKTQKE